MVGVGLIGSEQSQKIRYSVKVPANVDFDEFQLWTSGVLNLGLNTLRIYYGFMESADDDCSDPLKNGCALAVSTEETNASLSLQIPFQTVSVAGTLVNGDLLLDGEYEYCVDLYACRWCRDRSCLMREIRTYHG